MDLEIKQISKMDILYSRYKKQENNGVGDISSLFQRHCQISVNQDKASGPDEIPGRILKATADRIAFSLTCLFNKSLSIGVVPDEWKLANVVPVFKKGENDRVENYRPISLLCVVSKLLERCILNHIRLHLQIIINRCQHGFTPGSPAPLNSSRL